MIRGYATQEATEAHMQKHPVAGRRLGLAQLTVSQAGFGCYRVSAGVAHHEKALRRALREGINLIDTSTNYADGGSESLIGVLCSGGHASQSLRFRCHRRVATACPTSLAVRIMAEAD